MQTFKTQRPGQAFTRVDLMAALGAAAVAVLALLPATAHQWQASEHAVCVNNLRQVGRAVHLWTHDREGQAPSRVHVNTGGLMSHPLAGNIWVQFAWLSNQLQTPRVLVCPADPRKKAASDFGGSTDGGFANPGFRNNAVSYTLGTDAGFTLPQSWLSTDRHLRSDGRAACGASLLSAVNLFSWKLHTNQPLWSNEIHGAWGNVLHFDGRVSTPADPGASTTLQLVDENGSGHFLTP